MSIMDDEALVVNKADDDDLIDLPPGFRFHPTDEEIITHYLKEKVFNSSFTATAIGEADLNKSEPWDLPKKAKMGEKEWYFFCQRDRKYPTGMRTNRATQSGYWKATGKDKEIYTRGKSNYLIGMKKTLVFYTGRAPKGEKTNWVMHEYRLDGKFSYYNLPKTPKDEWVVSRVFHKSTGIKKIPTTLGGIMTNSIGEDDYLLLDGRSSSLPPLVDIPNYSSTSRPASSFTDCEDDFKGSNMASSANACRLSDNYGNNYLSNFSTTTTTTTAGMMNNGHHQQPQSRLQLQLVDQKKYLQPPNYNYNTSNYPTTLATPNTIFRSHVPLQNPSNFPFQSAPFNPGHLYKKEKTSTTDFKVEQLSSSNQSQTMAVSLASQDTGLSTDINTAEISSVVSKHEIGGSNRSSYGNLEGPLLVDPMADFSCLWDY